MRVLHLETSTKNCSVAISENDKLICVCEEAGENFEHSEKLHQFIEWALEGAEISLKELDAVCVSKGPGSYTGLRIGVSAAKGLCYGLGIPLYSLNSLEILAQTQTEKGFDFIIPMIDARRMEVYTSVFDLNANQIQPISAKILDEQSFNEFSENKIIFIGDGVAKFQEIYTFQNAKFITIYPSANEMVSLSHSKFKKLKHEDIAYFEPFYLKEFIGGVKKP